MPYLDFNPRTHVGCDWTERWADRLGGDFNPRTHVGCDGERLHTVQRIAISIHAPTWGATAAAAEIPDAVIFQSTHPRGVRHLIITFFPCIYFISIHAPTWGATAMGWPIYLPHGFQSTHPRGVRPHILSGSGCRTIFQSTHPRGVRRLGYPDKVCTIQFQSTHPRGVRPL